jgi:UDP-perosamine 4-acetyltransferase
MRLIGIGAGGHCRVVMDAIRADGFHTVAGLLDADAERWGTELDSVRVLGGDALLQGPALLDAGGFFVGLGSVGDSRLRERLFAAGRAAGLEAPPLVHPQATVSPLATLGAGTVVLAGARVNPGARIGENVIVNTGAIVEHDALIGDHAHVAPGAIVLGAAEIGAGAHVGAGATVLQGLRVGERGIIGMGAAVVRDVAAGTTVVGVPARLVLAG